MEDAKAEREREDILLSSWCHIFPSPHSTCAQPVDMHPTRLDEVGEEIMVALETDIRKEEVKI